MVEVNGAACGVCGPMPAGSGDAEGVVGACDGCAEGFDGGDHALGIVGIKQRVVDLRGSRCHRSEQQGPVGQAFGTGWADGAIERGASGGA